MSARDWIFGATLVAVMACGDAPRGSEDLSRARQAIVGGRASGEDENFSIYLESGVAGDRLRCSGTLVAPNVVLTTRHCLLLERDEGLPCTPDGEIGNPSDPRGQDTRVEAPENIQVYYGQQRSSFVSAGAVAVYAANDISICKSDIGLIVLEQALGEVYVPIRREPVHLGETFSVSGWGYTDDGQAPKLPEERSTLESVRVAEVGPGLIPAGTFAIPGNTLCFGDSGSGAMIDGALVGVYSRIAGPPDTRGTQSCTLVQGRNVFAMTAPHLDLFERAFAAAGSSVWYAGETAPWLASGLVDAGAEPSDAGARASRPSVAGLNGSSASCSVATALPRGQRCASCTLLLVMVGATLLSGRRRRRQ